MTFIKTRLFFLRVSEAFMYSAKVRNILYFVPGFLEKSPVIFIAVPARGFTAFLEKRIKRMSPKNRKFMAKPAAGSKYIPVESKRFNFPKSEIHNPKKAIKIEAIS